MTLAIGHEFRLGTGFGPPLAYWLAEAAFDLAGGRLIGPYLLAQACVVITLWNLMALGRSIVGPQQSALAILLTVGVAALSVPSPDFGPWVLLTPLWSMALLHAWRIIAQRRRQSWFALAVAVGLMLLTSYFAIVLVVLLALFFLGTRPGRAALRTPDPWLALIVAAAIVAPFALWLSQQPAILNGALESWHRLQPVGATILWLRLLGDLMLLHAGVVLLVALASGWPLIRQQRVPMVVRHGTDSRALPFTCFFAIAAPLAATFAAVVYLPDPPLVAAAPVAVLTALAIVVVAGNKVALHRQRILAYAWAGLLLAPPTLVALLVAAVPRLLPLDLRVAQQADAIGRFFGDTFERRTGQPLMVVTGDRRLASLVALSAPSRPHLYIDEATTPWMNQADIDAHGAVVIWPAVDTPGAPPPTIAARFPDLIPEVPHVFERLLQGFGPPVRIGWGVIRSRRSEVGNRKF
jgi:4-amino-4-deoxy-L-arabinose transferase-like glycosyltransferase